MRRTCKGFTLIEMMLVIALIAILAGIAVPALHSMILNNRIVTTANSLLGALQLARNEAATLHRQLTLCPSADQATCSGTAWEAGGVVLEGVKVIRLLPSTAVDVLVQSASEQIVYDTSGRLVGAATSLSVLDARGAGSTSRIVCINLLGQASIARGNQECP